ncbi:MAG: polysaccharide biosynthesis tyrosine autokinase [Planctomycetaceae bacterium]|nr:polysaccharide biosynthesis tyrosine autokinase [Planctomycetaceae bacterium]
MTPGSTTPPPSDIDFAPLGHIAPNTGARTIDIVQFAVSIWKPLVIGMGGGLLLGLLAYLYLGPSYEASTRILVSEKSGVSSRQTGTNLVGDRGEHVTLIRSDAIVHRALTDHGLIKLPAFEGSPDPVDDVIDGLRISRTAGRENSKDNVFDISFTHPDPETTREVVAAIIKAYRDFLDERQMQGASDITVHSETRAQELREQIKRLEQEHFKWRDSVPPIFRQTPVVTANGGMMVLPNRREQELDQVSKLLQDNFLSQQDTEAKLRTLRTMLAENRKRDEIEFWIMHSLSTGSGERGGGGGASLLSGPPAKANIDGQLMTARMLESRLLNIAGPDHDDVRKIRREIETILSFYRQHGLTPPKLDALPGDARGSSLTAASNVDLPVMYERTLENQLEYYRNQEIALNTQLSAAEERAKQAALLELEDTRRKDEIQELKKEYAGLINDINAFKQSKDSEGFTVTPIAQIRVATSMKRMIKLVGAGSVFGLCLVFGLAYFREWYDSTVRTPDELRRVFGVPLLGAVPSSKPGPHDRQLEASTGVAASVHYYHRPGSRDAEAYRSVRTTLFSATKDSGDKVIQISSPEPGDGKTTTACNLAVAIAQSGKKVLLIDADLRRPTVDYLLGLRGDLGLSEVLRHEVEWEHAVQPSRIDGLNVITSGQCPSNPAELLSLAGLSQLLRHARTDYDYILVDSPPILAVSDPCIISPHVDGMLLVVRMRKNKRAAITRTREMLETHGVPVYGVLANDIDLEVNGYGSGTYSEYYQPSVTPEPAISYDRQPDWQTNYR